MAAASNNPNHIDGYLGTSYGDEFRLEHVVDAVVSFANGDVRPSAEHRLLRLDRFDSDYKDKDLYWVAHEGQLVPAPRSVAVELFERRTDRARAYAIEMLDVASRGIEPLTELLRSFGDVQDAVDLAQYPTLKFADNGRPVLGWRVSGPGQIEQWIRFAVVMIADGARGARTDIAKCQLPSCNRFFRIVRTGPGKPSTKYCPGTDHMDRAHQANSTLRSQRKRSVDRRVARARARRGK
jgi:hypothetical protein